MAKAPKLEVTTLGQFDIRVEGERIEGLVSRKAEALFVYLVVTGHSHSREHLATNLWDDRPLPRSLANLSVLLNSLKKQLGPFLSIERKSISFVPNVNTTLDVRDLLDQINQVHPEWDQTAELAAKTRRTLGELLDTYQGDFMQGFNVRDARGFEEWMLMEKERIQFEVISAYEMLIDFCKKHGDFSSGIVHARRLLEIDPLREGIHNDLMMMLARTGNRVDALKQYLALEQLLDEQLNLEPDSVTKDLYERIRTSENSIRHNLAVEGEMLFGREGDLAALHARLQVPNCRLITILGPGGIGKSSLARRFALESVDRFINGAFVVALSPAESTEYIPQFISNAIGFRLQGEGIPLDQLTNYLREKEMLLVLDNFEHLLAGKAMLHEILDKAPGIKILVTSRVRLNHEHEWVHPLQGLEVPELAQNKLERSMESPEAAMQSGAIALFEYAARKVKPGFRITRDDLTYIVQVCQLVEGMPLGIELAAAWLRALPIMEIANQMASDVDFLITEGINAPDEPDRIKTVFDRSWGLLSVEEQIAFIKLTAFKGSFSLDASTQIAGTNVPTLASLLDKSMLRQISPSEGVDDARYDIHEILRQYAFIRFKDDKALYTSVKNTHSRYYCGMLKDLTPELHRTEQFMASLLIERDLGNILAAWRWACETKMLTELESAIHGLFQFYLQRGWFNQGAEEFKAAIDHFERKASHIAEDVRLESILAKLRSRLGVFRSYLSLHDQANEDLRSSLEFHRRHSDVEELAFTLKWAGSNARMATRYSDAISYLEETIHLNRDLNNTVLISEAFNELGAVALRQSRYNDARRNFEESIQLKQQIKDEHGMARSLINLGIVAFRTGDYKAAKQRSSDSLQVSERIGDRWGIAASLNNLGFAEEHLGNYGVAKKLYQQSLEVKRSIGHRKGMAYSMLNLAMISYRMGDYAEALSLNIDARSILEDISDRWGLASAFQQLGRTYLGLEQFELSREHFYEALSIGLDIETPMYITKSIIGLAEIAAAEGAHETAHRIVSRVLEETDLDPEAKERACALRGEITPRLQADEGLGEPQTETANSLLEYAKEMFEEKK